jgi:D-alanyl-D-alanine carboxypeptidase/D-alanyl-D-alanine-endopeptidase (penicillin-binding protein 4)
MILLLIFSLSIDSILNQPELQRAQVGMIVVDLTGDSVIYARNCRKNLVPASNVKIITSAAALTFLGSEFRFKTWFALRGMMHGSVWDGDVIVVGAGDPSLELEAVEQFVTTIKSKGISGIIGNIILVDDYFTDERLPIGWAWHYLDARYAAEISAISLNRNVINVHIEATTVGQKANVFIEPNTEYVRLVNEMITKVGDDSVIIFRRPEANIIYVDGGIGYGHSRDIEVAVKNPTMFFGEYLKERLNGSNVTISGECLRNEGKNTYREDPAYRVIDSVISMPMFEIIKELNKESVNLYGEAVLKTLGAYYLQEGSFRAGVSVMKEFLRRCGADTSFVALYDGSGLSRHNLVSSYDLMLVMRYMYHSDMFEDFYRLLPGPGEGTLEYKLNDLNGFVRAKTGTLDAVSCLSGYMRLNDTDYCFSLLFNNFTCSNKEIEEIQEDILMELKKHLEEEA